MEYITFSSEDGYEPYRANTTDAGWDLKYFTDRSEDETIVIDPHTTKMLGTSVKCATPPTHWIQLETRSSMAKRGIVVVGGIVDPDYRGEIKVILANMSDEPYSINKGDRIVQAVVREIVPITMIKVSTDKFESSHANTGRGDKGFGSSGR